MSEAQPTSPVSPEADNSGDIYNPVLKTQRAEKLVRLLFRFVDGGKQRGVLLLQVKLHYLWGRTLM
ncbi:hypothetical protein ACSLPA_33375, partial [Escherichia coli]